MSKQKKEPIKNVKIWIIFAFIFFLGVPWYLPVGTYEPIILGFPYWAFIVLLMSVVLSGFLTYVLKYEWNLEEEYDIKEETE